MNGFQSKIDLIQKFIKQLNDGEMTLSDLNELEKATRELHERSVILRYTTMNKTMVEPEPAMVEETVAEEPPVEEKEEESGISFDFGGEEETVEEEVAFDLFEEKENDDVLETEEGPKEVQSFDGDKEVEQEEVPQTTEETPTNSTSSFYDSVDLKTAQSNTFSLGKLTSLIGSFGLNERLRFINELFDGDGDQFGEAIKQLDNRNDLSEAKETINYFAKNNEWESEDDCVVDFLLLIERRYA